MADWPSSDRSSEGGVEKREAHDTGFGHLVAQGVVGLDESVRDLAVAGDAAVVLVQTGQPACAPRDR